MSDHAPLDGKTRQRDHGRANARAARLRHEPTKAETQLWKLLRGLNKEGAHFRRQAAIGDWVFDFADVSNRLLIEVDGGVHRLVEVALRDAQKADWARSQGFQIIRVANEEVFAAPDVVIGRLRKVLELGPPPPTPPHKGEGR